MQTSEFEYDLPSELIAQQPLANRAAARMMVVRRAEGTLEHRQVCDLPAILRPGDLLVLNDTKVIPARLFGRKPATGGKVEILLLEEQSPVMEQSAASQAVPLAVPRGVTTSVWEVLLKASSTPEPGSFLELASGRIRAEVISRLGSGRFLLRLNHDQPLMDILNEEGVPPLPPYIKRRQAGADGRQTALDRESYQTVYAKVPGAIAAPTAGLHFTPDLLEALARRGIEHAAVTLHVGLGTFKPVTTATVEAHRMEPERYGISAETACRLRAARTGSGRIVAVGSTVVRVLETVMAEQGDLVPAEGRSRLFIHPPYNFRAVQALLTNFHLPASTLLMMVSAFAGRELIRHAYATAIRERYRFYSYGDCMLIL